MKDSLKKANAFIEKYLNKGGRRRLWIMLMIVAIVMITMTLLDSAVFTLNTPKAATTEEFLASVKAGDVDTVYYSSSSEMMRYTLLNDETKNMTPEERSHYYYNKDSWRQTPYLGGDNFRYEMLVDFGVNLKIRKFEPMLSGFWSMVFSFVLIIIMFVFILTLVQNGGFNQKKFSSLEGQIKTTFNDVIGQDEVLDDLKFIVRMMKGEKLDALGARIPKGILLSGPPGTGKTLIARAVAGEAGVPFFSANASEFIDMYVGVGPKTVRTLFKQARKNKPCVIFIDEIDAVASTRGAQGTTSEDNKTVNALLQEMDGFDKGSGIFVIAATNNPDSLDPAIVRAGRFDRQVIVNPPRDWHVRKKMFDLYIKDTACNADVENLAKQTVGFTGADINAVVNEAKLVAAMEGKDALDSECFETAIDKKVFKANRSTARRHRKDVIVAAYHEAGHAVMNYLADLPIARASIVGSTSGVGGAVFQADKDTSQFSTKDEYEWQIRVCYAGRASESVKFGKITDGAGSDITQATKLIYAYVCKFGMCDDYGLLDVDVLKSVSAFAVPNEIMQTLSRKMMEETISFIEANYNLVEAIAAELLDKETLSGEEIMKIIGNTKTSEKSYPDGIMMNEPMGVAGKDSSEVSV
jgi:cell division protease FtsH